MKKAYIFIMMLIAITVLSILSCNSDSDNDFKSEVNNTTALFGKWLLLGYGSDDNFIGKESNWTDHCFLVLKEDGKFEGKIGNEFIGTYTFKTNGEFDVTDCRGTCILFVNPHIVFMEEQVCDLKIKSYKLLDDELKLFYSSSEYLKFRKE